jgi:phage tail-like protein
VPKTFAMTRWLMADEARAGGGDPFTVFRFSLTIDGVEIAQFPELTISSEVEPVTLRVQDDQTFPKQLPGKRIPPTVRLTRVQTDDLSMSAWHQSVVEGLIADFRKNCTLTMFSTDGKPAAKYFLENAWPAKIEISAIKAGAGNGPIETVTLTCEDIQRVAP